MQQKNEKKSSVERLEFIPALTSGLNRRAFLQLTSSSILLVSLAGCKPEKGQTTQSQAIEEKSQSKLSSKTYSFTQPQKDSIFQVQMHLFPDDGDGPSAQQINALSYLQWALTDPDNNADGDGEFIAKGVGWLDALSEQTQGNQFIKLSNTQQNKILTTISQSPAGENWLSLLIYYLMEALLFDPIYGGNPNAIGWQWIQHQPGFPRPEKNKTYRNFI